MTEMETYSFGEWLKQRREQMRLTQRELAAMTFCSVAMIKKIEAEADFFSLICFVDDNHRIAATR